MTLPWTTALRAATVTGVALLLLQVALVLVALGGTPHLAAVQLSGVVVGSVLGWQLLRRSRT